MSSEKKTSVFQAKVQGLRRVPIPSQICKALGIKQGDTVEIIVQKVE